MPDNSVAKETSKIPFWRNVRVRSWLFQILLLLVVSLFLFYLYRNFKTRTASSPVPLGFDFLKARAGIPIEGSDFNVNSPLWKAFIAGFLNTVRLVVPGLILTTILGIIVGAARLSKNIVVRSAASAYVEAVRNIPLLVFIVVVNLGFVQFIFPRFNSATDDKVLTAWQFFDGNIIVSRRGLSIPWLVGSKTLLVLIIAFAALNWFIVARWRRRVSEQTGALSRAGLWGMSASAATFFVGWFVFGYSLSYPEVIPDPITGTVSKATGGINMPGSYFTMLMALVIYTSSHVAEIIRGSIQAVHKGQGEAASALALSAFQRMWHIVLPQALRSAIPPLGNQYLNLMKNSSLAGVVAYSDLASIARSADAAPAIPTYLVTMSIYLFFSLVIALLINLYNRRMALVTR